MKNKNWFWGAFLILAAVVIVATQVASPAFAHIGFWTVLAGVLLVAAFVQSIIRLNFTGMLLSGALFYIVFQKPLHWPHLSPWLLLVAALLCGIGLSMLVRPRRLRVRAHQKVEAGYYQSHGAGAADTGHAMSVEENGDDNWPEVSVSFGGSSRYLHSDALRGGVFRASFGALEVFFAQATLAEGGADITVDCSFGSIKLYVPRHWQVMDNVSVSLGAMQNDRRNNNPEPGTPQLRISGDVSLGAVEVEYV